jgi:hypothetical protein
VAPRLFRGGGRPQCPDGSLPCPLTLPLLVRASTAWTRCGGDWEPVNNQPFTVQAYNTTVDVTPDGQGILAGHFRHPGKPVPEGHRGTQDNFHWHRHGPVVNDNVSVCDPGKEVIVYANGDLLSSAPGQLPAPDARAGCRNRPAAALCHLKAGSACCFGPDGSMEVQRLANRLQDICAAPTE